MARNRLHTMYHWFSTKDQDRNLFSAALHMVTISMISMSLAGLKWFTISGGVCSPYLTLSDFFWFGYLNTDREIPGTECFTTGMVNMMRIIILLCFMAIIFSLGGFFLDILTPRTHFYRCVRKYAVPNICLVLWVMAIISASYSVVVLLEDALGKMNPTIDSTVAYGSGFYLIAGTGGVALISIFYTLILVHNPTEPFMHDDRCLIDDSYEDGLDSIVNLVPAPPPPYNVPPPPYRP